MSDPAPLESADGTCVACAARTRAPRFTATERLLDSGERFRYWECPRCGCVQIDRVPGDLARHYPGAYFAYRAQHRLASNRLRAWLDPKRLRAATGGRDAIGTLANRVLKPLDYAPWCTRTGLGAGADVLDVGCGSGKLLVRLRHAGFARCVGVDPYLASDLRYRNGVTVRRAALDALAAEDGVEPFDLIMFHHSLEHVPEPVAQLDAARRLLRPGGWVLVRIPVAGTLAWREYREHWVQLDAPRHLFVPSVDAMHRLAARAGLTVADVLFDSTAQQFAVSEMYRAGVSPSSERGRRWRVAPRQRRRWATRAAALNAAGDGDQAAFFLRPA